MTPQHDVTRQQAIEKAVEAIQAERRNTGPSAPSAPQIAALNARVRELEENIDRLHKMTTATIADFYARLRKLETAAEWLPGFFNEFRALQNDVDWIKKSAEFGHVRIPDDSEDAGNRS